MRNSARKNSLSTRLGAVLLFACLSLLSASATAGEMNSVANYSQYQALSNNPMYQWSGAYTFETIDNQIFHASCVAIAPTVVIGPGHFTPTPTGTSKITAVTFGVNYNDPDALTIPVASYERYPGYVMGDTTTIDLAVYLLAKPIPGFTKPVTFASPAVGEMLTMVDYGDYGDPSVGELPSLGDRLAGNAVVITSQISPYPSSLYTTTIFNAANGPSDPTGGLQYTSGAPWYDAEGDLDMLQIAGTNGTSDGREDYGLTLDSQPVQDYLQPFIQASWASVPEPTGGAAVSMAAMLLSTRRRKVIAPKWNPG